MIPISLLNSLLEGCLCDLKLLFDTMDPNKEMLTAEFWDNFFSADHHTYSTFDSWYPSKEQHAYQQFLAECPECIEMHSQDVHTTHIPTPQEMSQKHVISTPFSLFSGIHQ